MPSGRTRPARLAIENLSWRPDGATDVLLPLSLSLDAGSILTLVGPNGSGKSSLLRLIYRYHRPTTGRILVDGQDIWSMKPRDLARQVAVVLQEQPVDFSLTVRDIVTLGRTPHRNGITIAGHEELVRVDAIIAELGLAHLSDRSAGTLSGGERQQVMLARALVQDPRILVLDEPTNHLDIRHQLELLAMLRKVGITVVCSLHDLNAASEVADMVVMLSGGRMLACGSPHEVMSAENIAGAFAVGVRREQRGNGGVFYSFHI